MHTTTPQPSMCAFSVIWSGQLLSLIGTALSSFALSIWAWDMSGSATALALVSFFGFGATILATPFAGPIVDRIPRKRVLILSDLGAAVSSFGLLIFLLVGQLEIWHLCVASAIAGIAQAFQYPAYAAAVSMLSPPAHLVRAGGMLAFAQSSATTAAPILSGILLGVVGLQGVLIIDLLTFCMAMATLAMTAIPEPPSTQPADLPLGGQLRQELFYGFRYILARPGLRQLQILFLLINLTGSMSLVLLSPLILARSGGDALILGWVRVALGIGGICAGLVLTIWGGPQRRIHGVLLGWALLGLTGDLLFGVGRSAMIWIVAAFCSTFFYHIAVSANQAIWQTRVEPEVQGRVFAARRLSSQITAPLGMLVAGPLADGLLEPAMQPGGSLAGLFGWLVGVGPGAGLALLFVVTGILGTLIGIGGYLLPAARMIEPPTTALL
ncbi:MFS transporter [Candidatus Oscillochloris fontis]|uniref:MFS transporter n=1 Tax=Candidatus Oscillochloris fontis TaxID=2496868 RepID=UPI00101BB02D|nr:MFS transporter [Candidatus Oscillochloris fontis]